MKKTLSFQKETLRNLVSIELDAVVGGAPAQAGAGAGPIPVPGSQGPNYSPLPGYTHRGGGNPPWAAPSQYC
jgi:hypothetical protein